MSETIVVNVNGQSTAWASNEGKPGVFAGPLRNAARDHAFAGTIVELAPGDLQAAGLATADEALAAIIAASPGADRALERAPGYLIARVLGVTSETEV